MQLWFYLLFVLHITEGCTLVSRVELLNITAHTGESVILTCCCTDLHTTPKTFIWRKLITYRNSWEVISRESNRDRFQLVNDHSPANLSLLISHLTAEDGGDYRCEAEWSEYIDFRLTVKEAPAGNYKTAVNIIAHVGESVLLPCYCPICSFTPMTFIWRKLNTDRITWTEMSSESGQYRDKFQWFNDHSPANLSLLILHLTKEDGGLYRCDVKENQYTDFRITVHGIPPLGQSVQTPPFVPFALGTVIFLHIIVAVVYHTKRTKAPDPDESYYNLAVEQP